ncbi:HNH endonuclease [Apibacter muscae]|uniref:HNH endonuclease n=1 Tax=Apibacter muscae TaxID=2509004 RepID=UPI001623339C|nr:HNH endonuclease [Apibacter muscae]
MRKKIKGRPSNYRKGLQNDDKWQEVRRKIKIRDKHKCRICGNKLELEVHHITYCIDGESTRGIEIFNLEWLITLCHSCHHFVHQNKNHKLNPNNPNKISANYF